MNLESGLALLAAPSDQWARIAQTLTDDDVTPFIAALVGAMVLLMFHLVNRYLDRKSRLKKRELDIKAYQDASHLRNPFSKTN